MGEGVGYYLTVFITKFRWESGFLWGPWNPTPKAPTGGKYLDRLSGKKPFS